jgi:hypothetical protein
MRPAGGKILVNVNPGQKGEILLGGKRLMTALKFATNYREKSPVMAFVAEAAHGLKVGTPLVVHHNRFHEHSAYLLDEGLFAIPYNESIFFRIDENGDPHSMHHNIICERIPKPEGVLVTPASLKKNYTDRVRVLSNGYGYKKGQEIYTKIMADYEVIYNWNGQERRVIKVVSSDIVAILLKKP